MYLLARGATTTIRNPLTKERADRMFKGPSLGDESNVKAYDCQQVLSLLLDAPLRSFKSC